VFVRFGFPGTHKLHNHRSAFQVGSRNQTTPSHVRCEDYSVDLCVWYARGRELDFVSALEICSPCNSGNDPIWGVHRILQGAYFYRIRNKFSYHLLALRRSRKHRPLRLFPSGRTDCPRGHRFSYSRPDRHPRLAPRASAQSRQCSAPGRRGWC
jgi:hypothetical protein